MRFLVALIATIGAFPAVARAQQYRFPTTAADYGAYYPTAYKDAGGSDWNCGSNYYSGHGGSDFGGGSWAGMAEGRDIVAAAPGIVEVTEDGWPDECSTADCPGGGGFGNHVVLVHADGRRSYYAHMMTWSIPVSVGDAVPCGAMLGQMGSSGHSTGPHLHFELREGGNPGEPYSGTRTDPFAGSCSPVASTSWTNQGAYDALPGLSCDGTAPCAPVAAIACDDSVTGNNGGPGSTSSSVIYSCTEFAYSGPEMAWTFTAPSIGDVTVSLTGLSADLDLFVAAGADCATSACLGSSTEDQTSDETVQFTVSAGGEYTVIVDGWDGATSDFGLAMMCALTGDDDDATGDDDDATSDDDDSALSDDDDDDSALGDDDDSGITGPGPRLPGAQRLSPTDGEGCHSSIGAPASGTWAWLLLLGLMVRRPPRRNP